VLFTLREGDRVKIRPSVIEEVTYDHEDWSGTYRVTSIFWDKFSKAECIGVGNIIYNFYVQDLIPIEVRP